MAVSVPPGRCHGGDRQPESVTAWFLTRQVNPLKPSKVLEQAQSRLRAINTGITHPLVGLCPVLTRLTATATKPW